MFVLFVRFFDWTDLVFFLPVGFSFLFLVFSLGFYWIGHVCFFLFFRLVFYRTDLAFFSSGFFDGRWKHLLFFK